MATSQFSIAEHHKAAQTTFGTADLRKVPVWKGDHTLCEVGHRNGLCRSVKAWRLNKDCAVLPVVVGRPSARRFQSMAVYESPANPSLEKEDEHAWRAKGHRDSAEAKGVVPVPDVVAKIRENGGEAVEREMQHRKASFTDTTQAVAAWLVKFDAANAALAKKAADTVKRIQDAEAAEEAEAEPEKKRGKQAAV